MKKGTKFSRYRTGEYISLQNFYKHLQSHMLISFRHDFTSIVQKPDFKTTMQMHQIKQTQANVLFEINHKRM